MVLKDEPCRRRLVAKSCPDSFVTPWIVAHQSLLSMGFSTGVGCHFLLQGIFPTQQLNPGLLLCGQTLYRLSHQGSPFKVKTTHQR